MNLIKTLNRIKMVNMVKTVNIVNLVDRNKYTTIFIALLLLHILASVVTLVREDCSQPQERSDQQSFVSNESTRFLYL